MPARPPHVTRCGDLETSCTDVLLYFAAVLAALRLSPESNMYLTRRSTVGVTGFEPATSSSRSTVGESSRARTERELGPWTSAEMYGSSTR
jgi:hypothetical protein